MPADDLYWNPTEMESEELNQFTKSHIDPWDLENYAYIRQHLDSLELSSDCSSPEALLESSSTFSYVPGNSRRVHKYDISGPNYASIDEVGRTNGRFGKDDRRQCDARRDRRRRKEFDENPYETAAQDNSITYAHETRAPTKKVAVPMQKNSRTRSYSYTCGDYGYECEYPHHQIYSRLDDAGTKREVASSPIYDDIKMSAAPNNFGLSNYGHLKIDYSYSWNNLNKYIYN